MLPGNSATHLAQASGPVPPEPIAIIGMASRFPGAPDLDEFWQLLRDGRDQTTEIPADRLDVGAFYDSRSGTPGKTRSRWGGLIHDVEGFDAPFSGISPREAGRQQARRVHRRVKQRLRTAGRRRRRPDRHQDRAVPAPPGHRGEPGCRRAQPGHRLGRDPVPGSAGTGSVASCGTGTSRCQLVRDLRHQRARGAEEMLGRPGGTPPNSPGPSMLLPLSARSPQALQDRVGTCGDFPAQTGRAGQEFENTCYTASACGTSHECRTAVVARSATGGDGATGCLRRERDRCRLARGRRLREVKRRAACVPPGLHSIAAHRRRPSQRPLPIRRAR
jgi:hypothetical protein